MLRRFIEEFSREMELEGSIPEINGVYTIPLEDKLDITLTEIPQGFTLFSTLIKCPIQNKEAFYCKLLHANLFGQGTHGALLGLNDDGTYLTLSRKIDYNIDYKGFKDVVEDFINVVDFWREETLMHK